MIPNDDDRSLIHELSAAEIARVVCLDCGVNVIEIGDYCMLSPKVWRDQLGLGWDDNLCIACIEKQLGRKLKGLHDICPFRPSKATEGRTR
ncbi:hypothetical protein [Bradyrhizobium sp. CCBAU 051011]|uniref:hypothetical protein n=1 Tax=Bradyrhizobium sp. CCBAU 051011 TaxID=858422 RepID=UPI00137A9D20|nr:hypothetical protein [Bradyrhizobium sp. CCBAU 051011]